jgi:hypothetical protein
MAIAETYRKYIVLNSKGVPVIREGEALMY